MSGILSDPKKIPPTLEEVRAFLESLGSKTNPEEFMDFYTARGWKAGKVAMKDWQATARSWHRNGWGCVKSVTEAPSEWEIRSKQDRLKALKEMQRELRYPGGCAYPVALDARKQATFQALQQQIEQLTRELNGQ